MTQCLCHTGPDSSRSQGCGAAARGRVVSQTPRAALPGEAGSVFCPLSLVLRGHFRWPTALHLLSRCTGDPALPQRRPDISPMSPATAGVGARTPGCIYWRCEHQPLNSANQDLGLDEM